MDVARFRDRQATDVVEVVAGSAAVEALDRPGCWAFVQSFEGEATAVRFGRVQPVPTTLPVAEANGWAPLTGPWRSSLDRHAYQSAVEEIRSRVAAGTVYQANLCRVLEHDLPHGADLDHLAARLAAGNPAPYAARIRVDAAGLDLVSASPERFLSRRGDRLVSSPIKGTAVTADALTAKDAAENVMIVDLVRNDLSRVCLEGTVDTEELLAVEPHPGLVHLVSTVAGVLRPGTTWPDILSATSPPGSVSGAPKSSALQTISDLEPVPRGPYCGAIGWVDGDRREAELAVGIRTFWSTTGSQGQRVLRFGTGAGITWGSDAEAEWEETELKARRLIGLAGGRSGTPLADRPLPGRARDAEGVGERVRA